MMNQARIGVGLWCGMLVDDEKTAPNEDERQRDNRLNPIHKGMQGIQGLDQLGCKAVTDDGACFTAPDVRDRRMASAAAAAGFSDEVLEGRDMSVRRGRLRESAWVSGRLAWRWPTQHRS